MEQTRLQRSLPVDLNSTSAMLAFLQGSQLVKPGHQESASSLRNTAAAAPGKLQPMRLDKVMDLTGGYRSQFE